MSQPSQQVTAPDVLVLTPAGLCDAALAIAACRAGVWGILDTEFVADAATAFAEINRLERFTTGPYGVKISRASGELVERLIADPPARMGRVVISGGDRSEAHGWIDAFRTRGIEVLWEATSAAEAREGQRLGADGLVLKGNEAGGRVGQETAFVLLQRWQQQADAFHESPPRVWVQGGIGPNTAAACMAAGAVGVVLDSQVLLARESPLPEQHRTRLAACDGSESVCLGERLGETYRLLGRAGGGAIEALAEQERCLQASAQSPLERKAQWRAVVTRCAGTDSADEAWLLGEDVALAGPLADRHVTVGGIVAAIRKGAVENLRLARQLKPLAADSPLAQGHGTRYPVVQGPMGRVSDTAAFAQAVADAGALPFLALCLLRHEEVENLLAETGRRLGDKPWGVGLLGFIPPELRAEQVKAVLAARPKFALIAGGRPDQAKPLEAAGVATYLHVPSPGLLQMFLRDGARRFVLEGRECGGHVGPRSSFVLWESMCQVIIERLGPTGRGNDIHVLFAGGIHDGLSAAMVSVLAAPLAQRGVNVGVLMGTAYLFTEEAVGSGAIVPRFQQEALACDETVLLETAPGHAIRCIRTPYCQAFEAERRRLGEKGRTGEEVARRLELMNLGRSRVASKGLERAASGSAPASLVQVSGDEQYERGVYMVGQVAGLKDRVTTMAQLHEDVCGASTTRLEGMVPEAVQPPSRQPCDVAIIGMACHYPGAVRLPGYWENILNRVDAITEVPPTHWDWRLYYDTDPQAPDRIISKWGGFLDDIPFDPLSYGITPNSMKAIEPLQLLLLEAVRQALAHAGYAERPFNRERTAAILGIGGAGTPKAVSYGFRACIPLLDAVANLEITSQHILDVTRDYLPEWTEDSFPGFLMNVAAGRVANRFNFGGTNMAVDAACASSLAAVHACVRELEMGTADVAVAMGADTIQTPYAYTAFSKTYALSPTGRCRPFDAEADGFVMSEGVGVVVLKRLADAERDGDRIYAVIKGVGTSSDGNAKGITAPNPDGQLLALRRAYGEAGIAPSRVGLIEAHGTGTMVGDPAEAQSLISLLVESGAARQSCALGSVKSMIGHAKCAAGIAGLIKAAMALYRKVLPPTIVGRPNPDIGLDESPLYLNTAPRPWIHGAEHPRTAGVSAFGFGGTNVHTVLEEYTAEYLDAPSPALEHWPAELMVWRRASRAELTRAVEHCQRALSGGARPELADLSASLWKANPPQCGLPTLAVVATSLADLRQKLSWALDRMRSAEKEWHDPRELSFAAEPAGGGQVAFLFPGQGSQYPDMLAEVAMAFPEVRDALDRAERILAGKLDRSLGRYVYPPSTFSPEQAEGARRQLAQTDVAQPALGAANIGMLRLLANLGVRPDVVAGHSYGEYVALCAAGVLTEEDLIRLSYVRGRLVHEATELAPGAMAAVEADADTVAALVEGLDGITLANLNSPRQTVISGTRDAVETALELFEKKSVRALRIPVACAFHSPLVAPACAPLARAIRSFPLAAPKVPVFSNTSGGPHASDPERIADVMADHLKSPVRFQAEIEAMYAAGARTFVEVGPHRVLTGLVGQILGDRPHCAMASDSKGAGGLVQLQHLLARLIVAGHPVRLEHLFRGRSVRTFDLSKLSDETGEAKHSPTTWLVNGVRCRPINGPEPLLLGQSREVQEQILAQQGATGGSPKQASATAPQGRPRFERHRGAPPAGGRAGLEPRDSHGNGRPDKLLFANPDGSGYAAASRAAARAHVGGNGQEKENGRAPGPHGVIALPPEASTDDPGAAEVVLRFHQLIGQIVESQREVMLAYLQETADGAAAPLPEELLAGAAPAAPARPPLAQPESVESPDLPRAGRREAEPAAPPSIQRLSEQLLELVSRRTGYPQEMLDLDLDLEANLGIDSIKRVEILGALAESIGAGGQDNLESAVELEKLTGIRTLRGILDYLEEAVCAGSDVPAAEAQPAVQDPGSPRLDLESIQADLLELVSRRTGYPKEMLDLDLDLEANLGIDSIKRVEILGALAESLGAGGQDNIESTVELEKLTGIRTLRGILDYLEQALCAEEAEPVAETVDKGPAGQDADAQTIQRALVELIDVPLPNGASPLAPGGAVVLTDDGRGVAAELAARLADFGQQAVLVRMGPETHADDGQGAWSADLCDPQAVDDLLERIRRQVGPVAGLVHAMPLAEAPDGELPEYRARREVRSLYLLARALESDLRRAGERGGGFLLAATALGGGLGFSKPLPESFFAGNGGIIGFAKCLGMEWPEVLVRVVDLDAARPAVELADSLAAELEDREGPLEVGYLGARRMTWQPVAAPLSVDPAAEPVIARDSTILLTGGARGITAAIACELARRYRPNLVLVGRSELPAAAEPAATASLGTPAEIKGALIAQARREGRQPAPAEIEAAYGRLLRDREICDTLARIGQLGAAVQYYSADVRDERAMARLVEGAERRFGAIDGVIHGAGVIDDKLVRDKTPESFDRVFGTKVQSAMVLSRLLRPERLKFCVFFASIASRYGNVGQADYAAANEVLSKLAADLDRRWPARVAAIAWGPWSGVGMVSDLAGHLSARGVALIPPEVGASMLIDELNYGPKGDCEVLIAGGAEKVVRPNRTGGRKELVSA